MYKSAKFLTGILLVVVLTGCGAGKTAVFKAPPMDYRVLAVTVEETDSTVNVPDAQRNSFKEQLSRLLYEEAAFVNGPDLKIRYRFVQFNPGSQFTRWFWGGVGNAGEGSLTVEARFFDSSEKEIGLIQAEGNIQSGFFGGSMDFALEKAAEEIAVFTKNNFKGK